MDDLSIIGRHGFHYRLERQQLSFGSSELTIAALKTPDQVIDAMFAHLERIGAPDLLNEYCPYFGCLWPAARVLAEELVTRDLKSARVLELGCGLALPGLVAGAMGADVTVTDAHPDVERFLALNQTLNPSIKRLRYLPIDWRSPAHVGEYSIICGSDILYDKDHAEGVAAFCARHKAGLKEVIITDPGRPYAKDVIPAMERLGFQTHVTDVSLADGGERILTVRTMRFVPEAAQD